MPSELIHMREICKSYGNVQALRGATLTVNHHEIVGLVGDNGAGKSTLVKVLSGAITANSGEIFIRGERLQFESTIDAIRRDRNDLPDSALVPELSIARNLFLGREPIRGPRLFNRLDQRRMNEVADSLLKQVGIKKKIPPTTPIGSLSGGERQAVSIARAMHFDSDLIILDEPTNNLGVAETRGVLQFIRYARNSGHSCIFIAHNIYHVFQVVDRIAVMRHGTVVAEDIDPKDTTVEQVERLITHIA